jgi:hypothetical protein
MFFPKRAESYNTVLFLSRPFQEFSVLIKMIDKHGKNITFPTRASRRGNPG